MKIIILAGGGGTRLFPLSRSCCPKQFLKLFHGQSLLVQTLHRFHDIARPEDVVIVTNHEQVHHVQNELALMGIKGVHILAEPVARNTAPAIALAVRYCLDQLHCLQEEALFVTPSDHYIGQVEVFNKIVQQAKQAAQQDSVIVFGVVPQNVNTGYGYIEAGQLLPNGAYQVKSFTEKPDIVTARNYIQQGNYYWNSGMYAFSFNHLLRELAAHAPEVAKLAELPFGELLDCFSDMPNIAIDCAVAEKSSHIAMIPFTADWNDIGSWDAVYDVFSKDMRGNVLFGDSIAFDCSNTMILGENRLIAGIGLENLLVIETKDVVLVINQGHSQKVKDLVDELKKRERVEVHQEVL